MPGDDKNKKKPTKKVNRKKKTEALGLNALEADKELLSEKQSLQIEEVIKQAFLRFYDNATLKSYKVKDLEHLDTLVSEYLGSYMILGYDINGEKVVIMHATSPHDKDALVEHLRTTLLGIINPSS
jgi:hypothetical protein